MTATEVSDALAKRLELKGLSPQEAQLKAVMAVSQIHDGIVVDGWQAGLTKDEVMFILEGLVK